MVSKKTKVLSIIGCAVIIALLVVIIVLLMGKKKEGDVDRKVSDAPEKRNVVVNEDNAESVVQDMINNDYIAPGYYNAQMTNEWHFATADAVSEDAYVANAEANTNDVYFDVVLASNEEEVILASPVIPRGADYKNIKLDKKLDAGTYDCVLIYHLIDEDQNTVSTLRVGLTVIIEK